jgi:uncharacterized protein YbjT (DUF2867 family)
MADKKIIAVVGSTGAQGGGLVQAILNDPNGGFAVRAITRDPSKDKAKAIAAKGGEVVKGDTDDVESLKKAFAGAYGVFAVTNFWEHFSVDREQQQARNMAAAAKAAGVKHVVWSTLEDVRKEIPLSDSRMPTLQGQYKCPHFDSKGSIDHVFAETGVPTTFLLASFYWDNFYMFGMGPRKNDDGTYTLAFPIGNAKMPGVAADDIGKVAYGIFKKGSQYFGKYVGVAGEHISGADMAAELSKQMNAKVNFFPIAPDAYRGLGFPGAEDLGNMFQYYHDCETAFRGRRPVETASELAGGKLKNFSQWLSEHKAQVVS